jgi:LmbE family N-acetylglucosaminyl deacetylase
MSWGRAPHRREVLAAGALTAAGLGLAACGGHDTGTGADYGDPPDPDPGIPPPPAVGMSSPGPTPRVAPSGTATILHVVAHPDDDLFFLNPDLAQSIAAGHRIVGVCVTAAESDGLNGLRARHADVDAYAKARQNALRAAYGQMAAGDPAARWTRATLRLPNGAIAEADTLGSVTLVFLNIRKTSDDGRLRNLWTGRIGSLPTLVPRGSAVHDHYRYSRTELVDALVHLMAAYRPTLVRTMDPDPDLQQHNRRHPRKTDHGDFSDHEDHTATAQFTWAALARYKGPGGGGHWTAEGYRGYYNCRWPFNLSADAWQAKRTLLHLYSGDIPTPCSDPVGCADLAMFHRIDPSGWGQSTHARYVSTAPWLVRTTGGALAAFAVLDGQAAMWTESAPGRWSGPTLLGGGLLVPRLSVATGPDGRWCLVGERVDELAMDEPGHRRSIVLLEQGGRWQDLGNPDEGALTRQVGVPIAVVRGDGALQVFTRTSGKTPATRLRTPGGVWTDWQALPGPQIQEAMTALVRSDGRIELYGQGHTSLARWYQRRPGGPFTLDTATRTPAPATPPAAVQTPDGGTLVVFRLPRNGQLTAVRRPPRADRLDRARIPLGGQGGTGPVQLLPTPDGQYLVIQRNDAGTVSTATCPPNPTGPLHWTPAGPWLPSTPAAALDAAARPVLAALTPQATLVTRYLAR